MPDMATLAVFIAAALALVVIPGPNHIYILTRSVSQGHPAGLASAAGIETGTMVHVAAAALGLSSLLATSAFAFSVVKYAGVVYLVYLGLRALLRPSELEVTGGAPVLPLRRVYSEGVLVNLLNPKVALFFLALLPQFVDPVRGAALQIVVLGAILLSLGLASDIVWALAGGVISGALRRRPALLRRQRYAVGGAYLGLGAVAAFASGDRQR